MEEFIPTSDNEYGSQDMSSPSIKSKKDDDEWLMDTTIDTFELFHTAQSVHVGSQNPVQLIQFLGAVDNSFLSESRKEIQEEYFVERIFDIFE